jgi:hypothetical protein
MKITVKDLRSFLSDPDVPDEAIVEIGFERYDGNEDGTDIGYDYVTDAELLVVTRQVLPGNRKTAPKTIERLSIWATNYPEIKGKVIKSTRLDLE